MRQRHGITVTSPLLSERFVKRAINDRPEHNHRVPGLRPARDFRSSAGLLHAALRRGLRWPRKSDRCLSGDSTPSRWCRREAAEAWPLWVVPIGDMPAGLHGSARTVSFRNERVVSGIACSGAGTTAGRRAGHAAGSLRGSPCTRVRTGGDASAASAARGERHWFRTGHRIAAGLGADITPTVRLMSNCQPWPAERLG